VVGAAIEGGGNVADQYFIGRIQIRRLYRGIGKDRGIFREAIHDSGREIWQLGDRHLRKRERNMILHACVSDELSKSLILFHLSFCSHPLPLEKWPDSAKSSPFSL
jgi:hypothetical protein